MKADYSAQELRVLAHVTGDENLLKAFRAQAKGGKDPHLVVGEKIAGRELEKGTEEGDAFRAAGKRANYGFSYGAGWKRYQRSIYEDTAELIPDSRLCPSAGLSRKLGPRSPNGNRPSVIGRVMNRRPGMRSHSLVAGATSQGKGRPSFLQRSAQRSIQAGGADQLYLALGKLLDDVLRTPTSSSPPTTRWFWSAR